MRANCFSCPYRFSISSRVRIFSWSPNVPPWLLAASSQPAWLLAAAHLRAAAQPAWLLAASSSMLSPLTLLPRYHAVKATPHLSTQRRQRALATRESRPDKQDSTRHRLDVPLLYRHRARCDFGSHTQATGNKKLASHTQAALGRTPKGRRRLLDDGGPAHARLEGRVLRRRRADDAVHPRSSASSVSWHLRLAHLRRTENPAHDAGAFVGKDELCMHATAVIHVAQLRRGISACCARTDHHAAEVQHFCFFCINLLQQAGAE